MLWNCAINAICELFVCLWLPSMTSENSSPRISICMPVIWRQWDTERSIKRGSERREIHRIEPKNTETIIVLMATTLIAVLPMFIIDLCREWGYLSPYQKKKIKAEFHSILMWHKASNSDELEVSLAKVEQLLI